MQQIRELVRRLAPALIDVLEKPHWVPIYDVPGKPGLPLLEFWIGAAFDDWYPREDCVAILAVMSATSITRGGRPVRRRLVCGCSDNGEAYALMTVPGGSELIEGTPHSGLLLDIIRSKFGLPPGPATCHDLII